MSLDTLPLDFLPEIFSEVTTSDLKAIRLTNRVLACVAAPYLFRKVSINCARQKSDTAKLFFDSASQPYSVAQYAKVVYFGSVLQDKPSPCGEVLESGRLEKSSISRGVMALENAREITIDCKMDPSWVKTALLRAALRLPQLQRLNVRHPSVDDFCVPTLSRATTPTNIQSLQLGITSDKFTDKFPPILSGMLAFCPSLRSLTLTGMTASISPSSIWGETRIVQHTPPSLSTLLASLPDDSTPQISDLTLDNYFISFDGSNLGLFKTLTSISLTSIPDKVWYTPYLNQQTPFDGLWLALGEAGVQLERVVVEVVTQSLLDYLASYSGVSHLALGIEEGLITRIHMPKPELLDHLLKQVIPRHEESLLSLKIFTNNAGDWVFRPDWLLWLERCKVLLDVSFCVDFEPSNPSSFESTTKELLKFSALHESLRSVDVKASRTSWATMSSRERYFRGKSRQDARSKFVSNVEQFLLPLDQLPHRQLPLCLWLPDEHWMESSPRWLTAESQNWCFRC
ncbi:hypothetical protein BDN72DRAFT_893740 [Pluteus cervinus]|uniref:Uncharacterized protein n=1 Tax=Pluteus cervinus TaxID=181527 RepID=A0ACD3B878_9AGAR|nr:hypothetical protein BDN72DRAFT_893740 [Pluteus cervinus]